MFESSGGSPAIAILNSRGEMTDPCGVPWAGVLKRSDRWGPMLIVAVRLVRNART